MASSSFSPFKRRLLLALSVLLLFTPPIFSTLVFFGPLIVSTVLAVLAVVSFGQQGGMFSGQEEEASETGVASRPNFAVSSAATTEKISDVLMVGEQEVTWLEWLHNEDMEKCRAQEHTDGMPAMWDLDNLEVATEASVASCLAEKRIVDADGTNTSFAEEAAEKATGLKAVSSGVPGLSADTIARDGIISVTTQVDEKMILVQPASPVSDVSRVETFMVERECSVQDDIYKGDAKEGDSRADIGDPIKKGDAEKRRSRENSNGPIWDLSDDEEIKSSLRFSFFDNSCVTLNSSKA